ncbi:HAD-IA family hydrolase, partial [Pseudomonas sp. 2822-15]|uniref:HAD-IA family hydrolase n=1 Tax=Pseudomonas sp. 2822-15 TaxID=1712677 RepID=UPI001C495D46
IKETALKGMKLMGIDRFFDVIVALDQVDNYKPHPEPLEKAMKALGSVPEKTLMIGDSQHDILGGKTLGRRQLAFPGVLRGKRT